MTRRYTPLITLALTASPLLAQVNESALVDTVRANIYIRSCRSRANWTRPIAFVSRLR